MKKKVYKILLGIGILWIALVLIITVIAAVMMKSASSTVGVPSLILASIIVFLILGAPGIILAVVGHLKGQSGGVVKEKPKPQAEVKPAVVEKKPMAKKAARPRPKAKKKAKAKPKKKK